jgi:hypothetical protein
MFRLLRRPAPLALLLVASSNPICLAQQVPPAPGTPPDQGAGPVAPPAPGPGGPAADAPADPAAAAARIAKIWERIAVDPPQRQASEPDLEKKASVAKANNAFEADLKAMCQAADDYAKLLAGQPGDPRTLWQAGYGRARQSTKDVTKPERVALQAKAAEFLRAALDGAAKDADFRPDAEFWLGKMLLGQSEAGQPTLAEGVERLRTATLLYRKAARADDAGEAATAAMKKLQTKAMGAELRAFAQGVGAATEDFGRSTPTVREYARQGATAVGSPFPELPDMKDADGRPVEWKKLRGAPFVLHFFHAGTITGMVSEERDVETVFRPLWDRLHERGLKMVGVSMDRAIPKEEADRIRKNWEEWGTKRRFSDGSLATVRSYAEGEGVAWPWLWDGKWKDNPVSQALGGSGATTAHALVVDAEGVIRWRGDAPFTGLPEAVDAAMAAAEKK